MRLQRDSESPDGPTFGTLIRDDGTVVCQTFEHPWKNNAHNISRIPAGAYTAVRFDSPHIGYQLFQVRDVPGRSGIDIHVGNRLRDTEGCVLLGLARGQIDGEPAILHSQDAFAAFMALMVGVDSFPLTVADVPQTVVV